LGPGHGELTTPKAKGDKLLLYLPEGDERKGYKVRKGP